MSEEKFILTLTSLLQNPTGKSSAFMASRGRIIEDLNVRYIRLLNKYKKFKFRTFKIKNEYLFLFEIPSETYDGVVYDVALSFYPPSPEVEEDKTLARYNIKLFSNSPSFIYTYAYVINKAGLMVDLFKNKCGELPLKDAPKIKNPVEIYGFEKSCYFAALYIKENKLYQKSDISNNLFVFDKIKMQMKVKTIEGKLFEIKNAKEKIKREKQKLKLAKQKQRQNVAAITKQVKSNIKPASRKSSMKRTSSRKKK